MRKVFKNAMICEILNIMCCLIIIIESKKKKKGNKTFLSLFHSLAFNIFGTVGEPSLTWQKFTNDLKHTIMIVKVKKLYLH